MLEGLAAWVLNTYIGEYLENLNTDQLSIGLLQGYAELENVPLKRTALRKFDLPLCVQSGVIGKLTLSVPLTHLKSEPWVVTVSDLYIVLEPSHYHYDMEFEEQYRQGKKKAHLDAMALMHKKRLADSSVFLDAHAVPDSQNPPSGGGWWSYGASVMSTIVENIQLIVTNVHLRYEDSITIPGCSFACGVKIGRFSVQSANPFWSPGFVVRCEDENIRKLVELKEFSVYWDPGTECGGNIMAPKDFTELTQKMKDAETAGSRHHYLLSPLDLSVKMEKNTSKVPLKVVPPSPRFKFDLEPDRVNVRGSRKQFMQLRSLIDEWQRYHRGKPYRKWRPKAPFSKESAVQWWKFAIICHLERIRHRSERVTWKYAVSRARQANAYCKAYIRLLGKPKEFTKADDVLMRQIEREYELEELQLLREGAMRYGIRSGQLVRGDVYLNSPSPIHSPRLPASPSSASLSTPMHTPMEEVPAKRGYFGGWISSWWSGGASGLPNQPSTDGTDQSTDVPPVPTDPELRKELEKVEQVLEEELWDIYNETMDESAIMGRDLLFAAVNLSMKSLNVAFAGDYADGVSIVDNNGEDDAPRCIADASLDFGLRLIYLRDIDNRSIVTPRFEVSAVFGNALNLYLDKKQCESAIQALSGWSEGANTDEEENDRYRISTGQKGSPIGAASGRGTKQKRSRKVVTRKDRGDFQLVADVQVPNLKIDLRTDLNIDLSLEAAQSLVSMQCGKLTVCYTKLKPHICVVDVNMGSFDIVDLLRGNNEKGNSHLLKATGDWTRPTVERFSNFLSSSCPDISCDIDADDSTMLLSRSLPTTAVPPPFLYPHLLAHFVPPSTPPSSPTTRYQHRRKSDQNPYSQPRTIGTGGNERGRRKRTLADYNKQGQVRVVITLVDPVHEEFHGTYKQVGTLINVQAGNVEFTVKQQTLILLLDFFGLLSPSTVDTAPSDHGSTTGGEGTMTSGKKLQVEAEISTLKVGMEMTDGRQLGNIIIDQVQTCLLADKVGFSLNGQTIALKLTDESPAGSRIYPERLSFAADGTKNVQFLLYKYNKTDQELKREFDACLVLHAESDVHYAHTQRYLSELIGFWNHFIQVYHLYANAKATSLGSQGADITSHGFRLKVRVDLQGTKILLPTSSLDTQLIVADVSRLVADNDFLFASVLEGQNVIPDEFDSLMDVLQIHCEDVQVYCGVRVPDNERDMLRETLKSENIFTKGKRRIIDFNSYSVLIDSESLLASPVPLDITVARNLDTHVTRAVPDMAIHTAIDSVNLKLHVDTYAIIRAIVDYNLGEQVPASSSTIAQMTSACNASSVWTSLEVTCSLSDVIVDCYTQEGYPDLCHWARLDLQSVKFSFEHFSDTVQHIDLIFNEIRLIDTRFDNIAANKRENVFSTIFDSCYGVNSEGVTSRPQSDKLLGEIHYAIEPHCSTITLVFSHARILLITEWLLMAKSFLAKEAQVRKCSKDWKGDICPEKWKLSHHADTIAKTRVVTRAALEDLKKSNFKLKATLLESEIVFLEKPSSKSSLAAVLKATASVYFEALDGGMKFECRDSQLQIFNCLYGSKEETATALTNTFSCIAELAVIPKTGRISKYMNLGLLETVPQFQEYRLTTTLSNLTTKLSYRDWLALQAVWEAHWTNWTQQESTVQPRSSSKSSGTYEYIEKLEFKLESVSVCFLDDYQDTRFPLFKISVNDGTIEHRPGKSSMDSQEGNASLVVDIDYFNQKVYAWEPFLESWRISSISWSYYPVANSLNWEILGDRLLNLTVTRTFIQQTSHFMQNWPQLSESLAKDFRSGFTKRLDILPYLLVNQTGSELSFATCSSGQKRGNGRKISSSRWTTVEDAGMKQFSFHSDPWQSSEISTSDPFLSHHIVIRVDGWHEINPIPVDAVGTFFRLARLDSSKKSALSNAASYTRLVAAVSIDHDGRKVITVRSALMFVNGLKDPLTVRLEGTSFVGEHTEFTLVPGAVRPAPLAYASCKVLVRPSSSTVSWSYCKSITWGHVTQQNQAGNYVRSCSSMAGAVYRMCISVKAESYPEISVAGGVIPGHTISFVPPLIVNNLLPLDLHVILSNPTIKSTIPGGHWEPFIEVDPLEPIELKFETEYFHSRQSLFVYPAAVQEQQYELEMIDQRRRPLILQARITAVKGGAVKVSISAPFWFVNRSGLPLIIKQEASDEASGQFDEHEHARSMAPVLFSFAESGAPLKCCLRLGKLVHPDCVVDWCRSFVLEPGITFKELRSIPVNDRRPARVYNIGVEVRPGRGLYKDTKIVLLTARYLIDNRSRYKLHISQLYDAERQSAGQYTVAPNCTLAWHWPRQDLDLLLCIRRDDLPFWSSPFRIDQLKSFHLTLRDSQFTPQFLRLEIILRGAVYYVTFSSAENIPPPIRIENLTDAPVLYNQKACDAGHLRAVLRPHTQVNYSFDDTQFKPPIILLTAQNGKTVEYDLTVLGQGEPLLYENFIYIVFAATLEESPKRSPADTELVLDVMPQGKVILNRKDRQRPQQLWRMRSDGHLVNAADWSHLMKTKSEGMAFVLDILPSTYEPDSLVPLMLRPMDTRRRSSQRWRFTEDNRLLCHASNAFIQPERSQLKAGVAAVLGPALSTDHGSRAPSEQVVMRQRQRPGSGRLAVTVLLDGPTRVLRITDRADQEYRLPRSVTVKNEEQGTDTNDKLEVACSCTLNAGVGVSVVNSDTEELVYCRFTGLILNARREKGKYTLGVKVLEIQADNQLWNSERWTLLHIRSKFDEKQDPTFLALDLLVQWAPLSSYDSFDTFIVSINKVALYVDEILLWKILLFFSEDTPHTSVDTLSEPGNPRIPGSRPATLYQHSPPPNLELERPDPQQARRCYFGILNLSCRRLYLSVVTANVLPSELRQMKQMYNMPLIRFENASVEITPFQQSYYFETVNFLLEALHKHFTQELKGQAMKILGTVDFLGNPVGLFRDVSDSLQELIISANVSGFVTGIMHGFSNSAAKITSSLSDQVGKIAMDDGHRQLRESVRQSQSQDAMGHLLTGVKGLGIGVVGGVTSVFTQPVDGMKKEGIEGLFTGVVKGVVGMVAKPVQGVLDLATGVSNATREAVSGSDGPLKSRFPGRRLRFPRITRDLQGRLPPYSEQMAAAQRTLLSINDGNLRELCLSLDQCFSPAQQTPVLVLISTTNVYFIRRRREEDIRVVLNMAYAQMQGCTCVMENNFPEAHQSHENWQQPYLEFALKSVDVQGSKRRIKCDSVEKATELCQKILYAKQQYEEQERSLAIPEHYEIEQL